MILYHNTVEGVLSSCAGSDWPGLTWHVSPVQRGSAFPWQQDSLLEDMSLTDDAAVFVAVKLLAVNTPCCSIIEEKPLTKSHNKLLTLKVPRCLVIEKPLRTVTKQLLTLLKANMMKQWNTAGVWTEEQRSWKTTELNAERHFLSGFLDRHELSPGGGAGAQVYSRYGLAQLGAGKVERSKSLWHSLSWCRWKSPVSDQRNWQTVTLSADW